MEENVNPDIAKEVLSLLANLDDDFVDLLPDNLIQKLTFLAADSEKEFVFYKDKKLSEQNLTDECKNYLAFLYYRYSSKEKRSELLDAWSQNDL